MDVGFTWRGEATKVSDILRYMECRDHCVLPHAADSGYCGRIFHVICSLHLSQLDVISMARENIRYLGRWTLLTASGGLSKKNPVTRRQHGFATGNHLRCVELRPF